MMAATSEPPGFLQPLLELPPVPCGAVADGPVGFGEDPPPSEHVDLLAVEAGTPSDVGDTYDRGVRANHYE